MSELSDEISEMTTQPRLKTVRRAQRGQTLIVALAVLFVLLFIGGLFVAQIARNLVASGRSRDTQAAQALAEAGIRYCDEQLTTSEEGADWRPAPTPPITSAVADPNGVTDPDYEWLAIGFTRVPLAGGRALIRVTYDPNIADPHSQLIRVEAIGRPGDLGSGLDPTVFVQNGIAPRLRRELIAYKQIGTTDYLRFITNKNRLAVENSLGSPAIGKNIALVLGDPNIGANPTGVRNNDLFFGGGIRSNGRLRFVGDCFVYLSPRNNGGALMSEGIQVSDDILLGPTRFDPTTGNPLSKAYVNANITAPAATQVIHASSDPNYDSVQGLVRDASTASDVRGYSRNIPYISPPIIDTYVSGSGVLRYRATTRDSGRWIGTGNSRYNTGHGGWGTGVYVDNTEDLQQETTRADTPGSYSLRADWLNPNAGFGQKHWNGPFYRPPGVQVELLGDRIRLTRNDNKTFVNPDGSPSTLQGGKVIEIPLTDYDRLNYTLPDGTAFPLPPFPHDGDEPMRAGDPMKPFTDQHSYGVNVVLMLEGNARIKGVYGAITNTAQTDESATVKKLGRVHLTIVSGGTAYIEGNIVKGDGFVASPYTMERGSTCAILAKDYVCVNTTMFMSPQNQTNVWGRQTPDLDAFFTEIGLTRSTYDTSFSFGVDPGDYKTAGNLSPLYLMLRHAALAPGPTYLNLLVNPAQITNPGDALFPFATTLPNGTAGLTPTYPLGLKFAGSGYPTSDAAAVSPRFEQKAFQINGLPSPPAYFVPNVIPGFDNLFRFQVDQSTVNNLGSGGSNDYLLGAAMVMPLDIRIEALLYAQEKSFFVIPGYGFNPDPNDTRLAYTQRGGIRTSYSEADTQGTPQSDKESKDLFPFYGEPIDVRITIFGAVSENVTASVGDQAAWMARWGYIPDKYGSSGTSVPDMHLKGFDPQAVNPGADTSTTAPDFRTQGMQSEQSDNIARGLRFLYDPALAMPYYHPTLLSFYTGSNPMSRSMRALRYIHRPAIMQGGRQILSEFYQTLPPVPRLPVCPGLLYFGDADRRIGT